MCSLNLIFLVALRRIKHYSFGDVLGSQYFSLPFPPCHFVSISDITGFSLGNAPEQDLKIGFSKQIFITYSTWVPVLHKKNTPSFNEKG